VPPHVDAWRSVRAHGDTKTEKSRRTLQLPQLVVMALREHRVRQAERRLRAGALWQDLGLVFCTSAGMPLAAGNVRKMFRRITKAAVPTPQVHVLGDRVLILSGLRRACDRVRATARLGRSFESC
jgi:hypothetical protein